MANTIVADGSFVHLTAIDSDWLYSSTLANWLQGIRLISIEFAPAVVNDLCVIKEAGATGAQICHLKAAVSTNGVIQNMIKYFNETACKPFLDVSAGSYNAGAVVILNWKPL